MPANTVEEPEAAPRTAKGGVEPRDVASDVLVCINGDAAWKDSIPHALAVASSLGGDVVLVKVIETPENGAAQLDPVDWDIRKRMARTSLKDLAKRYESADCGVRTRTLEGKMIDQLCACASQKPQDIMMVSGQSGGASAGHVPRVADFNVGSVLMIPPDAVLPQGHKYQRIFLPLDGSAASEAAIPTAVALANGREAELLVCHITPDPGITLIGPPDEAADSLKEQIRKRNMSTGKAYLKRIGNRVKVAGASVKTQFIDSTDVRRTLLEAARKAGADLIVLASHGQGAHPDVASGHVASFILDHSTIPVLMVRRQHGNGNRHSFSNVQSSGVRVPSKTNDG